MGLPGQAIRRQSQVELEKARSDGTQKLVHLLPPGAVLIEGGPDWFREIHMPESPPLNTTPAPGRRSRYLPASLNRHPGTSWKLQPGKRRILQMIPADEDAVTPATNDCGLRRETNITPRPGYSILVITEYPRAWQRIACHSRHRSIRTVVLTAKAHASCRSFNDLVASRCCRSMCRNW